MSGILFFIFASCEPLRQPFQIRHMWVGQYYWYLNTKVANKSHVETRLSEYCVCQFRWKRVWRLCWIPLKIEGISIHMKKVSAEDFCFTLSLVWEHMLLSESDVDINESDRRIKLYKWMFFNLNLIPLQEWMWHHNASLWCTPVFQERVWSSGKVQDSGSLDRAFEPC